MRAVKLATKIVGVVQLKSYHSIEIIRALQSSREFESLPRIFPKVRSNNNNQITKGNSLMKMSCSSSLRI